MKLRTIIFSVTMLAVVGACGLKRNLELPGKHKTGDAQQTNQNASPTPSPTPTASPTPTPVPSPFPFPTPAPAFTPNSFNQN